jgi:SAM-dependent methyltransferase
MTDRVDPARYTHLREFYTHFAEEQEGALRVGHRSVEAQLVRFEVLLDALDSAHHPASILDVGCGVGDLVGYLEQTGRRGPYLGVDLLPDMIDEARRRYPDAEFQVADVAAGELEGRFDLVVASGTLNIAVEDHDRWVKDMLAAMWERTGRALAVNFTTERAYRFDPNARFDTDIRYLDHAKLLEWSQQLTPWVTLRLDYMARDATLYLYRDYHRAACTMRDRTWGGWEVEPRRACTLATLFIERGQPREALSVLLAAEPTAEVLAVRGTAHQGLRDFAAARADYRAALAADPGVERARRALNWLDEHGL